MKAILFRYSSWCLSLFCMLSMLSCVELDVIPTDKYTDETYWTSEANASALLNMAYKQMNSADWLFRDERLSDNLYNGYGGDAVKTIGNGQATSSTALFDDVWKSIYSGIKTAHTLLENIDRVPMDEGRKNRMKAEARFVRAFLFFQATNWYGDVPFFTEDIDEATAKTISPTTQSEIVAWIHKELEEIAEILPTKEEYDVTDRGRITAGAAMAMNARIALNFNEWEKVVQYTEKLINTDSTKTREYSIVRLHNGVAEVLEGAKTETVDGKLVISFSTDKFSTYVIVYKDTVNRNPGSDDGNKGDNKGDDNTPSAPDKPTEPTKPEKPVKPTNPTEPVTPTEPTKPAEPSTGDVTGNTDAATDNGAASNTDSTTAAATESGESTATGDMAHTAVYAVLAMVAAGLALAVVVYDNKKKRI